MRYQATITLLASLSLGALAQTQIGQTCVSSDVCYKLNIPEATAQSGSGDIYLSLSAPTTYTWVGLGIGSSMTNSDMFIMYTDGNGNVTLSPRYSSGESQPQYDGDLDVELLSGSGVANSVMTANFRCGKCARSGSTSFSSSSGQWVHGRKSGAALDSTDVKARISQHDAADSFTWSYSNAVGGSSTNPFMATDTVVSGTTPVSSGSDDTSMRSNIILVHGIFASLAFIVFFPIGAIIIRLGKFNNNVMIHVSTQIFSWLLFIAASGLGLYYGITGDEMNEAHPIIGIVLIAMMFIQPIAGWLHHRKFLRTGQRSAISYGHIWTGRTAIILGMINGGLGLELAGTETRYVIAYSVVAGVIGLAYLVAIVYGEIARSRRTSVAGSQHEKIHPSPERSPVSA
ncbi:iron reductase domain protein [Didymella exigua CBS 183.55]|uniref:Iron reductase domain protein n=1 Tax=Didymella exigua CBS 183.55 TaxID=1150837 RepID=A0A6A5RTN1_9PLEO|nr:iron reductase domain protein [Didymella exigua CBS 183.55]KAF1931202.1 iron reductase domain protein [Didymella exigua CBS 183.55]